MKKLVFCCILEKYFLIFLRASCCFGRLIAYKQNMQVQTNTVRPSTAIGNYTLLPNEVLGRGATGTVYKARHNITRQVVAIKAVDLATIKDQATRSLLENQKLGLKTIKAPQILKLQDIIEDSKFCYIVTELCDGVTLKEYLNEKKALRQDEAMAFFRQLTAGGLSLAHEGMIHRDLKPANVMIDKKGNLKIIDLGYCEIITAKKVMKTFNVGSPSYMSPEAYSRTLYSEKSDAWALGMILYELLHGRPLDQGMDIKLYFDELKNNAQFVERRISPNISHQIRETLEKALKYKPEDRASISAMKYQADLYHINQKKKGTNPNQSPKQMKSVKMSQPPKAMPSVMKQVSIVQPMTTTARQGAKPALHMKVNFQAQSLGQEVKPNPTLKVKFQNQAQSLKRVQSQNKIKSDNKGFVSYREFIAPENRPDSQPNHMVKMKQMTSLDDFDQPSLKAPSNKSKGVAMNQKLNQFLENTVKQHKGIRPNSSTSIPSNTPTPSTFPVPPPLTSTLSSKQIPKFPPPAQLYRHITMRYC